MEQVAYPSRQRSVRGEHPAGSRFAESASLPLWRRWREAACWACPSVSPAGKKGYRYDGFFRVDPYWRGRGVDGCYVWRYLLVAMKDAGSSRAAEACSAYDAPASAGYSTTRVVRDTAQGRRLKEQYGYRCQVYRTRFEGPAGSYAEAVHVRPLGRLHHGPDALENLLCLCPNPHVLFDERAFSIADDGALLKREGTLFLK